MIWCASLASLPARLCRGTFLPHLDVASRLRKIRYARGLVARPLSFNVTVMALTAFNGRIIPGWRNKLQNPSGLTLGSSEVLSHPRFLSMSFQDCPSASARFRQVLFQDCPLCIRDLSPSTLLLCPNPFKRCRFQVVNAPGAVTMRVRRVAFEDTTCWSWAFLKASKRHYWLTVVRLPWVCRVRSTIALRCLFYFTLECYCPSIGQSSSTGALVVN